MLYGTAWKEEETERLVLEALRAGFPGIDTANQRKHYNEAGAGMALRRFRDGQPDARIFVQTKFTYRRGQDHRLPYDPDASLPDQVRQSVASSLDHLGVTRIDSLLLHGPERAQGLTDGDWQVWQTMEALHDEGVVARIGISNVQAEQVEALAAGARVQPFAVQNRCYARTGLDRAVRAACTQRGIVYQGFSLLTANRALWGDRRLHPAARRLGATPAQVLFCFALQSGILPLTGTSDPAHMRADLACIKLRLTEEEVALIAGMLGQEAA